MLNKILFTSRNAAENAAGDWQNWAIISISEPSSFSGEAKLNDGWHSVCRVSFHDVIPNRNYDEPVVMMGAAQAKKIVEFVYETAPSVDGILVHCKAGISRSAAVAKWIASEFEISFKSDYLQYNEHVYRLLMDAAGEYKSNR